MNEVATEADEGRPVAIVTGAARGLGLGVVRQLLADGWNVCGVDLSSEVTQSLSNANAEGPERVLGVSADVGDLEACERVAADAMANFGRIDALVNNAGVGGPSTAVHETDPAEFALVLRVNLTAPFLMARACVPHIVAGGRGGAVVNIGSVLGQRADAGSGAYSASKAGLALLGQAMALELAGDGIRVNTVAPGFMMTVMHEDFIADFARQSGRSFDQTVTALRDSVPLGRHGTADDIGQAVAWLVSPQASYITGQTLPVNGGILLT